jgi:hypothetical protein
MTCSVVDFMRHRQADRQTGRQAVESQEPSRQIGTRSSGITTQLTFSSITPRPCPCPTPRGYKQTIISIFHTTTPHGTVGVYLLYPDSRSGSSCLSDAKARCEKEQWGDSSVRSLAEWLARKLPRPTDRPTLTPSDITLPRPASRRPSAADLARRRLLA